jgi:hypothetical protein
MIFNSEMTRRRVPYCEIRLTGSQPDYYSACRENRKVSGSPPDAFIYSFSAIR